MQQSTFLVNSNSIVISDPCKIFGDNDIVFNNITDGRYVFRVVYNDDLEIVSVKVIHLQYAFTKSDIVKSCEICTVFCASSRLGIFDYNFYTEHTLSQELKNQFYDLCINASSNFLGRGVLDDCCFVGCFAIANYSVHVICNDLDDIIGVTLEKI